jgi:hypothetical protein
MFRASNAHGRDETYLQTFFSKITREEFTLEVGKLYQNGTFKKNGASETSRLHKRRMQMKAEGLQEE